MRGRLPGSGICALFAVAAALALPATAPAAITEVFDGDVECQVQGDGVRFCSNFGADPRSTTKSFDGVPLDVNVGFPPAPAGGADGGYPLVMLFHGYGGDKIGLEAMRRFLDAGYATFSMTDRGFHESCGSAASRAADPSGCAAGYVRLIDSRYEVRDAQLLAGRLVDQGLVAPDELAAIGGSYGGGMSLALAALRDRTMLQDGSLVPWTSPDGVALELAAAAPFITWSDLAYSLTPNGSFLDYVRKARYRGRFGVLKESLVNGLYFSGLGAPGLYAPAGTDPAADLTGWRDLLLAGEPYDGNPEAQAILDEITSHHSAYYINPGVEPAPVLYANGFTDDLFPADEALRFYNRTRAKHPDAHLSLVFGEIAGHPRSTSKENVNALLGERQLEWFDHFVLGQGPAPFEGVTAFTQTCPESEPGGGPYRARTWARIAKGEIRFRDRAARSIAPDAGDPAIAARFDPVTGDGACATADGADQPGSASYRLDPAPEGGYTLLGSPTVIARFTLPGETSQVAARLLDVDPSGEETLIARGLWRPETGGPTKQAFQLHANGWHFAEGHVAKLELLPADNADGPLGGYGRPSNDQQEVTASNLQLRLPVREKPGALDGLVSAPAPRFVPDGYKLSKDFDRDPRAKLTAGPIRPDGDELRAKVKCPRGFATCSDGLVMLESRLGTGKRSFEVATGSFELKGGGKRHIELLMTEAARDYLSEHSRLPVTAETTSAETTGSAIQQVGIRKRSRR